MLINRFNDEKIEHGNTQYTSSEEFSLATKHCAGLGEWVKALERGYMVPSSKGKGEILKLNMLTIWY